MFYVIKEFFLCVKKIPPRKALFKNVCCVHNVGALRHQVKLAPSIFTIYFAAHDAEVTVTEKTVSVKKEKVTVVGEEETRVVENSPTFTQPLMPQTEANEGDTVQMTCQVECEPSPKVSWYHSSKEIISTSRIQISFDVTTRVTTLTIQRVTKPDEGDYVCRATNQLGEGTTRTVLHIKGEW